MAIRRKNDGVDGIRVASQRLADFLAARRVPEANEAVNGSGNNSKAVGRKSRRHDWGVDLYTDVCRIARSRVPESNRPVERRRDDLASVRREADEGHSAVLPLKQGDRSAGQ